MLGLSELQKFLFHAKVRLETSKARSEAADTYVRLYEKIKEEEYQSLLFDEKYSRRLDPLKIDLLSITMINTLQVMKVRLQDSSPNLLTSEDYYELIREKVENLVDKSMLNSSDNPQIQYKRLYRIISILES